MNILKALLDFIKNLDGSDKPETPDGYCPNCWGRQEYGGEFYKAVKNQKVDVNTTNPNVGWIQDYADKYLSDIALIKENDEVVCQKCKVKYKKQ